MRPFWVDELVIGTWIGQVVGYAALLALYPHSDPTPIAETLQRLPAPILIPIASLAVPAVVAALLLGGLLSMAGLSPSSIPAILLARGDLLVILSAYAIGLSLGWLARHGPRRFDPPRANSGGSS